MNYRGFILLLLLILKVQAFKAQTMEWLCNPGKYTEIRYMGHDFFKVKSNEGKWGILSSKGDTVFETQYDSITIFKDDRALIMNGIENRILFIINEKGEVVRSFEDKDIYATKYPYFRDGLLGYRDQSGLFGYLNMGGSVSINARFCWISPFQKGVATVQYVQENGLTYFGLINKSGSSAIVDDTKYKFLSSLVDGKLFAVTDSRIGNVLRIYELQGNKLVPMKKIESKMFVDLSDDYSYLASQNGHHYFIDNQWRIIGANYEFDLPYEIIKEESSFVVESTELLSKQYVHNGIQITYKGTPILEKTFSNVEAYEAKYAIVKQVDSLIGILRLNPQACIELMPSPEPFVFYHNSFYARDPMHFSEQELYRYVSIDVNIKNIEISNLECYINDNGKLYYAPIKQDEGACKMYLPYFQSDSLYNNVIEKELDIAITYDGLDWMHKKITVASKHEIGYSVTMDDKVSFDDKGTASFDIIIRPLDEIWHAPVHVKISNYNEVILSGEKNRITLYESASPGMRKTYHYSVNLTEEGCPTMEYELTKSITYPQVRKEKIIILE